MIQFKNCTISNKDAIHYLSEHQRYIKRCMSRYGNQQFYDELLSEGRLAVVHALQEFSQTGGSSLDNWIKRGIRNAIKNENRAQIRKRRFETGGEITGNKTTDLKTIRIFKYQEDLDNVLNALKPEYKQVLIDKFLESMTVREIAEKQCVSETCIYNLIQMALRSCRYKYHPRKR